MENVIAYIQSTWEQAVGIWLAGGWAMIAIAIVALVMFGMGMRIYLGLAGKGHTRVPEKVWRHWIGQPEQRKGQIGKLLDFVDEAHSLEQIAVFFDELRATEVAPFTRDLRVMKICVNTAPLLGLLGTVTGMLATFGALASGSGADKTMDMVAGGISEALITTETGLVIAIPGLFFQYQLSQKFDRYKVFIAHLETVCTQRLYRKMKTNKAA